MAADTRPFKSKEQDGQGNEVIIRDQQLVEQASQTTMASGEYFEIVDVDGRMAKIPKANMMSVVLEAIRILLDDSGSNISAANLTKILGLSASSIGNILPTDLASVLGDETRFRVGWNTSETGENIMYLAMARANAHPENYWTKGIIWVDYGDGNSTLCGYNYYHGRFFDSGTPFYGTSMATHNNNGTISGAVRILVFVMQRYAIT